MVTSSQWRVLRDGNAGLVLTVAFDARRGDARFSDLAALLDGHRVLEAVPLGTTTGVLRAQGAGDYVAPWLTAVAQAAEPVVDVLGHCGGAVLARELAARLRASGLSDPVLLSFDPIVVDSRNRTAVRTPAAQLSPEELGSALDAAHAVRGPDLLLLAETLEDAYLTAVAAACRHVPVAREVQRQPGDRFAVYLTYLAAASWTQDADPAPDGPVATTVLPATGGDGTCAANPRGHVAQSAADRTRLLADAEVAAFVSKVLSR